MNFTALFPFCGLGAGALGFLRARVELLGTERSFRCLGGIDLDAEACSDFEQITGVPALCADVRDLSPEALRAYAGQSAPSVVFLSPPCQGASPLVGDAKAEEPHYQQLNELALVWTRLMLAAWKTPPALVLLENVPGIKTRAASMLREVCSLLRGAGYVLHQGLHDCGEIGGLAQRRKRFLLVARHAKQVPSLLYKPATKRVRGVGEVLDALPMPDAPSAGAHHKLPRIEWINWLRLALIPAGKDWKAIPAGLFALKKEAHPHTYGVLAWDQPAHTVTGTASTGTGPFSVADPRLGCSPRNGAYGVLSWDEAARTVTGSLQVDNGFAAVADPRIERALRERPEPPPVVIAADGTWHRPLTTLELAVLQGLPSTIALAGRADSRHRTRIGNAVPVGAAESIARQMLLTLANAAASAWTLSTDPVWVAPRTELQ